MNVSIDHPTDRPNFSRVTVGNVTIWFSYRTPIAFQGTGNTIARVNDWSATTGNHLNHVGVPREDRVSGESFVKLLAEALKRNG